MVRILDQKQLQDKRMEFLQGNFGGQTIDNLTSLWWKAEGQKENTQEIYYYDPEPEYHNDFDYCESDNDHWEDDID